PVLPSKRVSYHAATTAGAPAGYPTIGPAFCRAVCPARGQAHQSYSQGSIGCFYFVFLAGERAGTSELDRTSGDPFERRSTSEPSAETCKECGHHPCSPIRQDLIDCNSFTG